MCLCDVAVEGERVGDAHGEDHDHSLAVGEQVHDRDGRDTRPDCEHDVRDRIADDDAECYHSAKGTGQRSARGKVGVVVVVEGTNKAHCAIYKFLRFSVCIEVSGQGGAVLQIWR